MAADDPATNHPPAEDAPLSPKRLVTDILLGIALPTVCVLLDHYSVRVVFTNLNLRFSCYLFMLLQMCVFITWCGGRYHLRAWAAPVAGALCAGTIFGLCLGAAILPLSLIGLMIGIGILGFSPFVAAFVFWRSSRDALRLCREHTRPGTRRWWFSLAFVGVIVLPLGTEKYLNTMLRTAARDIISPSIERQTAGKKTLESFEILARYRIKDFTFLYKLIDEAPNPEARKRIEAAVNSIVGW